MVIRRLDSLSLDIEPPAWLKLDVQGYEDRVIAGAAQSLEHVVGMEVELSLAELYRGQADCHELIAIIHGAGFRLRDLEPSFVDPADGRVLSLDAIFDRPSSRLPRATTSRDEGADQS